jgi:pseudaminic acid biosynthesis-associated methylase
MSGTSTRSRLERLWAGEFGDDYVERNSAAERGREAFWKQVIERLEPRNVLEVGCSVGGNLRWIADAIGDSNVSGIDLNEKALRLLRERLPGVDARVGRARELPFEDRSFDLVLTMGVLIHQPPEDLEGVMREIVRCSRSHVLCGEYHGESEVEVPYRGQRGALFRRDYGAIYAELFPELSLVTSGFLQRGADSSWDDVTYWIFEKPVAT